MINPRPEPVGVQILRSNNRTHIVREVARQSGISRSEIAKRINLTEAAVSRISRDLIDQGLIREVGEIVVSRPGRRHIGLELNPGGAYVLSACLAISEQTLSLVNLAGEAIRTEPLAEVLNLDGEAVVGYIADQSRKILRAARLPRERVLGMGVVTAGAVDHGRGTVLVSSIKSLTALSVGPALEQALGIPVRIETIGNAINSAEAYHRKDSAPGQPAVEMLVHIALGLGASVMIDGRPYRSTQDERLLGHTPVPGSSRRCGCGAIGCLTTLASGHALLRQLSVEHAMPPTDGDDVSREMTAIVNAVRRANEGDPAWASLFHDAGMALGLQLAPASSVMPPQRVTLAGPMPQARAYVDGVRAGLMETYGRVHQVAPEVHVSQTGYTRAAEIFALAEFLFAA
ncbi:ROK family transcriptional regulator [Xanthobacter sp. KR7-225]|uniref:ROK family transcriptional regulator n=1 Tax=Xanthobacter sp. KR7-225 TaxID=3156613 RepID=UPI0032B3156E